MLLHPPVTKKSVYQKPLVVLMEEHGILTASLQLKKLFPLPFRALLLPQPRLRHCRRKGRKVVLNKRTDEFLPLFLFVHRDN